MSTNIIVSGNYYYLHLTLLRYIYIYIYYITDSETKIHILYTITEISILSSQRVRTLNRTSCFELPVELSLEVSRKPASSLLHQSLATRSSVPAENLMAAII